MAKDWWKTFFNEHYVGLWGAMGMFRATEKEVNFLEKAIPLRKGQLILDLCCGHGRHSLELAKRGYQVLGLDYSAYELDLARKAAHRRGLDIKFYRADARSFRFNKKFDAILNLFTAFGYGSREDDRKIIHNVSRHLKRGGKFLIDLMSLPWIFRHYRSFQKRKVGPYKITAKRSFDFMENVNTEIRKISFRGKTHNSVIRARFYTLSELCPLFTGENLKVVKTWGSFDGKPYGLRSKRMIVLANKL